MFCCSPFSLRSTRTTGNSWGLFNYNKTIHFIISFFVFSWNLTIARKCLSFFLSLTFVFNSCRILDKKYVANNIKTMPKKHYLLEYISLSTIKISKKEGNKHQHAPKKPFTSDGWEESWGKSDTLDQFLLFSIFPPSLMK